MKERIIESFQQFYESILDRSPSIILGLIGLVLFVLIGMLIRSIVRKRVNIHDVLLKNFISRTIMIIFVIIGTVIFLNQLGLGKAASSLLAGAGVSAIIIGFAFKDIGENFLAGFFLAFGRPFSIGDVIEVEGIKGIVSSMSFRNTQIRSFDGRDIFIPNAMLIKNPLTNFTRDGLQRHAFVVGLDYGDNVAEAIGTIKGILSQETRIPQEGELEPFIELEEFGTSTINLRVYYWINSFNYTDSLALLKTEVMRNVLNGLMNAGYTMPADIIELKIYQEGQPIPVKVTQ
ncbi:mechanosensitive ion channel family protein [Marinoscillum pacificum]|uniref:mechanosensitive ion channel family protein n=1 Tax=Marinoscillum pacificum TaxID=392723 RepID=UPI00215819C5|nr:mechanosensitive ion channel family protein [Marinoscillum pacificum]